MQLSIDRDGTEGRAQFLGNHEVDGDLCENEKNVTHQTLKKNSDKKYFSTQKKNYDRKRSLKNKI